MCRFAAFAAASVCVVLMLPARPSAQSEPAAPAAPPPPSITRWFELQTFSIYTRYRLVENSNDVRTSNQLQYKDAVRARINLDASKRYTISFGFFSGSNFIGTWNNWGVGHNTTFDGRSNYLKQLFASAAPVDGFEVQYGGLYLDRGEGDEFITFDDDGYLTGSRVSIRRPRALYFDQITVTRAALGPFDEPSLLKRRDTLGHPNYTQVLLRKQINTHIGGSVEYNRQSGADLIRLATSLRVPIAGAVNTIRYEQYWRMGLQPATGFGIWGDRPVNKRLRLQGGYVSVDRFYGGWNADRMQSGRRWFGIGTISIAGPLSASIYATYALHDSYAVPVHRRFDAVISYDVLDTLRRAHVF